MRHTQLYTAREQEYRKIYYMQ